MMNMTLARVYTLNAVHINPGHTDTNQQIQSQDETKVLARGGRC